MASCSTTSRLMKKKSIFKNLTFQVVVAIILGIAVGYYCNNYTNQQPPITNIKVTEAPRASAVTAPIVNAIKTGDTQITGFGKAGETVNIAFPDETKGTATVDEKGKWSASIPSGVTLNEKDVVTISQTNEKESSPAAKVTVVKPSEKKEHATSVYPVDVGAKTITGKAEAGETVRVAFINGGKATTTVDADGNWSIEIPKDVTLKKGDLITAKQIAEGESETIEKLPERLKLLFDAFLKLIKMVIPPIIFLTVVIGIGNMGDLKKVGRIGGKALIYFEIVTTFALFIGLVIVNIFKPGNGFPIGDPTKLDASKYVDSAKEVPHGFDGVVKFFMDIIPDNLIAAVSKGDLLPVLFAAVLFGAVAAAMGARSKPVLSLFENFSEILFGIVAIIMRISPIAAFGALANTVGIYGLESLKSLGFLLANVYLTMAFFIFIVLGAICYYYKFSIFKFLAYIKEEIFLVIGTSSSETALPRMMKKLENFGCSKSVVGLVVPTGYSFNLDGTSIYLSMASMFIAQAMGVDMSLWDQLTLMGILLLTSKGAAGVAGSGLITLAATLAAFPTIPVAGLMLIVGVDKFMSEARAVTNLIGNGVATIVISKSENEFDDEQNARALAKT